MSKRNVTPSMWTKYFIKRRENIVIAPWEPRATQRWCCSLCLLFGHSASSIVPGCKTLESSNEFFIRVLWLTSSSCQHRRLARMTSPSSKNSARMTKSNWEPSSEILASTFASFFMSAVARPRSHSCWFWKTSQEVLKHAQNKCS